MLDVVVVFVDISVAPVIIVVDDVAVDVLDNFVVVFAAVVVLDILVVS